MADEALLRIRLEGGGGTGPQPTGFPQTPAGTPAPQAPQPVVVTPPAGSPAASVPGLVDQVGRTVADLLHKIGGVLARVAGPVFKAAGGPVVMEPRGTDTVPAMLTPGEVVVDKETAAVNRGLLDRMVGSKQPAANYAAGGPVYAQQGLVGAAAALAGALPSPLPLAQPRAPLPLAQPPVALPAGTPPPNYPNVLPVNYPSVLPVPPGPLAALANVMPLVNAAQQVQAAAVAAMRGLGDLAGAAIRGAEGVVSFAAGAANAGADVQKFGDAITAGANGPFGRLMDTFTAGLPIVSTMNSTIGEAVSAFGRVIQALDQTADRYGQYDAGIAQAQAFAEVRSVLQDLKNAREVSPELSKFVDAKSELQQRLEDTKVKILERLLPLVTQMLEGITNLMPLIETGAVGVAGQLQAMLLPLKLIADAASFLQRDADVKALESATDLVLKGFTFGRDEGVRVPDVVAGRRR